MPFNDYQHPVISAMEKTGYPDGKEPTYPHCPICGEICETVYYDRDWDVAGCDECIKTKDAWEATECFPEED